MKHWLIIIITSLHDGAGLFFFFANLLFNLLFCIFYIYLLVFTSRHLKNTLIPASDNSAVVTGVSNDLGIRWKEKKKDIKTIITQLVVSMLPLLFTKPDFSAFVTLTVIKQVGCLFFSFLSYFLAGLPTLIKPAPTFSFDV